MKKSAPPHVVDSDLWVSIRSSVRRLPGPWSAYKSGLLVQRYKRAGGRFRGPKTKKGLTRWFNEKWVDLSRPTKTGFAPCGRANRSEGRYPLCRPLSIAKRIRRERPDLIDKLVKAKRSGKRVRFPAKYEVK